MLTAANKVSVYSLRDYLQLTRPRIVVMVLFAVAVAAWTSGQQTPMWQLVAHVVLGTGLITAGSVALNQRIEYRSDALMPRTRTRPIPAGRISPHHGLAFGASLSLLGLAYLAVFSTPTVTAVAAINWVFYVALYTTLKPLTAWHLPLGAVAGAMPMLIGAAAAGAYLSPMALILFAIVFFWQFPHTVAIAWIYRDQYAQAGLQVISVGDPTGRLSGVIATASAALLLPLSLLPSGLGHVLVAFGWVAIVCSAAYFAVALRFLFQREETRARQLLWASLAYLPTILFTLLVMAR